jgi:hypothetical protein
MSHISRIKTKLFVKEFLLKAIEDLGYTYEEGDLMLNGLGGNHVQIQIKIPLRLSYDIGFRHTPQGYEIVADWWGVRGVKQPDFISRLSQRYAYHATRASLEAKGFALVEETNQEGAIHLTLRRMA